MKNIFISIIFLICIPGALLAQNLSEREACIYDSEYFQKIEIKSASVGSAENLSVDVSALENSNFEVKLSVNEYFKPFVIMGAKISDILSSFNLSNLGKGIGANIHMNKSFSCYAKYSSITIKDVRLIGIDSSAVSLGVEYNF